MIINKIEIENFKAFDEKFDLDLDKKNLLVYGDNGTGKSSLFEALKVACFKTKIIKDKNLRRETIEDTKNKLQEYFSKNFNNSKNRQDYVLKINDQELSINDENELNIKIFMIDNLISYLPDQVEVLDFLKKQFFKIENIEKIDFKYVETNVNNLLKDFKEDNIAVSLEEERENSEDEEIKRVWLKISDNQRGLENRTIKQFFNEAKVNLIVLLIVFETIKISSEKGVIVLDDFITSLDIANRVFLIKYIFESFKEWQLIIFTHNLEFFNLMCYIVDEKIVKFRNNWKKLQLYELDNKIGVFDYNEIDSLSIDNLQKELNKNLNKIDIANKIRKKFENILHRLSIDLIVGSIDKSDEVLTAILNEKNIYIKKEGKKYLGANYILNEIEKNLGDVEKIRNILNETKIPKEKLEKIREILREIKLYRKVILHPLSHNQAQFNMKELYKSLELVKNLDYEIKGLL